MAVLLGCAGRHPPLMVLRSFAAVWLGRRRRQLESWCSLAHRPLCPFDYPATRVVVGPLPDAGGRRPDTAARLAASGARRARGIEQAHWYTRDRRGSC